MSEQAAETTGLRRVEGVSLPRSVQTSTDTMASPTSPLPCVPSPGPHRSDRAARITAIIVNYKVADQVLDAVASIERQAVPVDLHLVDNSVCARQAKRLRATGLPVLENRENVGFGRACNQVYRATQSDYLLLLNPDARLLPGALAAMRAHLDAHPEVAAVGPRPYWDTARQFLLPPIRMPSNTTLPVLSLPGPAGAALRQRLSLAWRARALRFWCAQQPLRQDCLSGGHVLLRRSAVDAAGGLFDPSFFLYWEDVDLFRRLRAIGARADLLPAAGVIHPFGASSRSATTATSDLSLQSRALYMRKHHRWSTRLTDLLRKLRGDAPSVPRPVATAALSTPIPQAWQRHWCIELSPEPLFLWPLGLLGRGPTLQWPQSLPDWVTSGQAYARLGPATGVRTEFIVVPVGQRRS